MLLRHARRSVTTLLAALLALMTLPVLNAAANAASFDDVNGSVYQPAVDALAREDIVLGCTDTSFCPNDRVNRAQIASLIARAKGLPAADSAGFTDVTGVHEANIDAIAASGITRGCTETRFCPTAPTTREQMATLLDRAFAPSPTSERWFVDTSGLHTGSIDRLAANGITAGCSAAPTHFCPRQSVTRGQVAIFLARALNLVPRVDPVPLAEREAQVRAASAPSYDPVWDRLAKCESGGNWSINTGNGYYGGLQFSLSSWRAVGGSGYPHHHSKLEQINRGERLLALQGWGAWPSCSRQLGLR